MKSLSSTSQRRTVCNGKIKSASQKETKVKAKKLKIGKARNIWQRNRETEEKVVTREEKREAKTLCKAKGEKERIAGLQRKGRN